MLVTVCIAGGASRGDVLGQVVVRGVATGVLIVAILFGDVPPIGSEKPVFLLLSAIVLLLLAQLAPLPPEIWTKLPGRAVFETADIVLARPLSWRPWAIAPGPALNAVMSLLVPFATFLLLVGLSAEQRKNLPGLLLCLALASAIVAVLQVSGARFDNPLVNDVPGEGSGFFANRNHLVLLLAQGCLLVPGWAFAAGHRSRWRSLTGVGLILLFLLTILATGSRAGILLGGLALAIFVGLAYRAIIAELGSAPRWVAPAVIAGACGIVVIVALVSMAAGRAVSINRAFAVDAWQDIRYRSLPTVLRMIGTYFPFGSGAGSFDAVFRLHEPFGLLQPTFFNHAHNDVLEVVLTTGLPGVLLLMATLGWWAWASTRAWRAGAGAQFMLPKLGSAMLLLVFVASLFDYPARTPMIMATTVIAAVWLSGRPDNRELSALPRQDQHL